MVAHNSEIPVEEARIVRSYSYHGNGTEGWIQVCLIHHRVPKARDAHTRRVNIQRRELSHARSESRTKAALKSVSNFFIQAPKSFPTPKREKAQGRESVSLNPILGSAIHYVTSP